MKRLISVLCVLTLVAGVALAADWSNPYPRSVSDKAGELLLKHDDVFTDQYAASTGKLNQLKSSFRGTSAPTSPSTGQLWYDTTNKRLSIYDSSWGAGGYYAPTGTGTFSAVTTTTLTTAGTSTFSGGIASSGTNTFTGRNTFSGITSSGTITGNLVGNASTATLATSALTAGSATTATSAVTSDSTTALTPFFSTTAVTPGTTFTTNGVVTLNGINHSYMFELIWYTVNLNDTIRLYYNGDTTNANYYYSGSNDAILGTASMAYASNKVIFRGFISTDLDAHVFVSGWYINGGTNNGGTFYHLKPAAVSGSNLTRLDFVVSGGANGLGTGSSLTIWRMK